jgi:hypothetical protein
MPIMTGKSQVLEEAGYAYSFDRLSYINRDTRKIFSIEFVQDTSEDKLKACIDEPSTGDWHFYFNSEPSDAVKREFSAIIGR